MAHVPQHTDSRAADVEDPKVSLATEKPKRTALKVLAIVGGIVLTAACLFGIMLAAVQVSKEITVSDDEQLVNSKDSMPLRFSEALDSLPLEGLAFLPLNEIQKMESLHINMPEQGSERVYNIEGVFRDLTTNTTEVHLSLGHKLLTSPGKFSLVDEKGAFVYSGEYDFEYVSTEELEKLIKEEADTANDKEGSRRRLGFGFSLGGFGLRLSRGGYGGWGRGYYSGYRYPSYYGWGGYRGYSYRPRYYGGYGRWGWW
ncbi:unnamed protein product [Vitrella brassicaformis CCMP3155]|uniref:Uncharacterized protein n=1 Tax=Vitrella brassicaformis (strain CCMP3155) TaxID=1169540 RepID=A0A0G4EJL5_VITBC|nr:unnamed protein product [Vitrella brassicaformis CCMP3155]|mmetsp:Transcript_18841/g.45371  ORF Transcript_18841/g.45371 Transcript_18841/m.45371 type:complete len:257 (-) Transcript_18841:643-1413(-)|eukprot:CEL96697.1 unnamed protein product [Vitrella brassicaformis CCMP3155]